MVAAAGGAAIDRSYFEKGLLPGDAFIDAPDVPPDLSPRVVSLWMGKERPAGEAGTFHPGMIVVIDCNVVTSAGLGDGRPRRVVEHILVAHRPAISAGMAEYRGVARRSKFATRAGAR